MFDQISNIINSVGNSKSKRNTLIILLVFIIVYFLIKNLLFKSDCSGLIEQNEKIMNKNIELSNTNYILLNKNNNLVLKMDSILTLKNKTIKKLIIKNDTVYITSDIRLSEIHNLEINDSGKVYSNLRSNNAYKLPDSFDIYKINLDDYREDILENDTL